MRVGFLFILSVLSFVVNGQVDLQWNWVQNSIGKDGHTTFKSSYTDASGNIYVTGEFGSNVFKIDSDSVSQIDREQEPTICGGGCYISFKKDAFIAKLNNQGEVLWVQSIEGTESESGISITANELGEVWVLASTSSDTVSVDGNEIILTKDKSWYNASFVVKLQSNGTLDKMYQLAGDDASLSRAWIDVDGDNLNIISSFNDGGDNTIDVLGQKIATSCSYSTVLSFNINAETGTLETYNKLGFTGNSAACGISDVKFIDDGYVTYLHGGYNSSYYVSEFSDKGSLLNSFSTGTNIEGKLALNDSLIVVVTKESNYQNPEKIFKAVYFLYDGTKLKEYIEDNPLATTSGLNINAIELDEALNVVIASTFSQTLLIGNDSYTAKNFYYDVPGHGVLTNYYSDMLLLVLSYDEGLIFTKHIEGETFADASLGLSKYGNKIRYMASLQSPSIGLGDFELINDNDTRFTDFHGEPTGMFSYANILFSEFEVINDVNGVSSLEKVAFNVYPNPSNGKVLISATSSINKVEVYSISGLLLRVLPTNELQEMNFEKGTYLLRAIEEENVFTQKLIVK